MTSADAESANMSKANLAFADVSDMNADNANLLQASLENMIDTTIVFLRDVNLSKSQITQRIVSTTAVRGSGISAQSSQMVFRAIMTSANLSGATIANVDLTGATLKSANVSKVTWINVTCPDGTNSDAHGKTCIGHLTA